MPLVGFHPPPDNVGGCVADGGSPSFSLTHLPCHRLGLATPLPLVPSVNAHHDVVVEGASGGRRMRQGPGGTDREAFSSPPSHMLVVVSITRA